MKAFAISSVIFIGLIVLGRWYFLNWGKTEMPPARYDRPVLLRQLAIPKSMVPSGYALTGPGARPAAPDVLRPGDLAAVVPEAGTAKFPAREKILDYLVGVYTHQQGEKVAVVTARYRTDEVVRSSAGDHRPPQWTPVDSTLTWIYADTPDAVSTFQRVFEENARAAKVKRAEWEKVFVAGDAYLRLFMNVLVGAFGFLVVLFFVKYFLIIHPTQKD